MTIKLGLTLGGGGARGAAHVGALIELVRLGVQPRLITGTSIGGLVGALLAAGQQPAEMATLFRELTLGQLLALPGSSPAISGSAKLERRLEKLIGRPTFSQLATPLAVVAVDLVSRKQVVLDEGDVISAVLATMAFPLIYPPVEWDGMQLVDGGLLNNLPFDIARARGATHVIAIDLTQSAPFGSPATAGIAPTGMLERALALTQRGRTWQVLTTVTDIITERSLSSGLSVWRPDILLRPAIGTIGLFDFHRWEEALACGKAAVRDAKAEIEELVKS